MARSRISILSDNKSCRICLDNDDQNDLISPCLCTGGSAYVHRKCLDNWRALNKNGRAFNVCEVCQFEYLIEPVIDDPVADRKRLLIFRLLVTRDITFIIVLVQVIIIGMAFLLQLADKTNYSIKDLYPTSFSSFAVYYLSSLVLFFAFVGLFGLIGFCCGWGRNTDEDQCNCTGNNCFCFYLSCNGCDGHHNCNGNHNCGGEAGVLLIVIIFIFAAIGVFVGIVLSAMIIRAVIGRHTKKLWLRQETKKYVVKDFQGRRNELPSISIRNPMTDLTAHREINSDKTLIIPSAPVEPLAVNSSTTQ